MYSFERFYKSIKNYEKFALGYTNQMRMPMTLFTTLINSVFVFLIGTMVLLIAYGFDAGELMPDFMFYVIFTPIVAVTANKMMFASENNMLAKDAVQRMEGITKEKAFQYPERAGR